MTTMTVSLPEIIRTGAFGRVRPGLSSQSVREILGPPEDTSADRNLLIWKYGSPQLFFHDDRLGMIVLYLHATRTLRLPACVRWEGWAPRRETTIEEFRRRLDELGADYRTDSTTTLDDQIGLAIGPDVGALFQVAGETTTLYSISIRQPEPKA